ncbi:MAG: 2-hydroxyacyl-CoA dehydratase subunit D, partial [Candidatus Geothermincolia bacterium]
RFCRACLQLGLDGTYDFLDGLIETNGCDHLRGMFENWIYAKKQEFFHYLKVPHFVRSDSLDYFAGELFLMRKAISEHFGVDISDADITEAIRVRDEVNTKLKALYDLRQRPEPGISGSEFLAIINTGSSMMSRDYSKLLDEVLAEKADTRLTGYRARLILAGAATDEVELLEEIEAQGGLVVADTLCFGSRVFWNKRGSSEELLPMLAEGYLSNLFCPRMYAEYDRRRDHTLQMAEQAGVQGAIVVYNKFCDLHGVDSVSVRMDLEKSGLPVLVLEKEYGSSADIGRIKTRVQAFLERIGG